MARINTGLLDSVLIVMCGLAVMLLVWKATESEDKPTTARPVTVETVTVERVPSAMPPPTPQFKEGFNNGVRYGAMAFLMYKTDNIDVLTTQAWYMYWVIHSGYASNMIALGNEMLRSTNRHDLTNHTD